MSLLARGPCDNGRHRLPPASRGWRMRPAGRQGRMIMRVGSNRTAVAILIPLLALLLCIAIFGSKIQSSDALTSINLVAVDMDIANTPGNTATTVGSIQSCGELSASTFSGIVASISPGGGVYNTITVSPDPGW